LHKDACIDADTILKNFLNDITPVQLESEKVIMNWWMDKMLYLFNKLKSRTNENITVELVKIWLIEKRNRLTFVGCSRSQSYKMGIIKNKVASSARCVMHILGEWVRLAQEEYKKLQQFTENSVEFID